MILDLFPMLVQLIIKIFARALAIMPCQLLHLLVVGTNGGEAELSTDDNRA